MRKKVLPWHNLLTMCVLAALVLAVTTIECFPTILIALLLPNCLHLCVIPLCLLATVGSSLVASLSLFKVYQLLTWSKFLALCVFDFIIFLLQSSVLVVTCGCKYKRAQSTKHKDVNFWYVWKYRRTFRAYTVCSALAVFWFYFSVNANGILTRHWGNNVCK